MIRPFDLVSKRVGRRAAGGLLAALALSSFSGCRDTAAKEAPPPPTVGVVESRRMSVPIEVTPNGTTRALEDVTIRARVRGFLTDAISPRGRRSRRGSSSW